MALAYEYDLRGNRVRERSAQDGRVMKEFSYDGANRMVRGTTEKGSSFYRYDGLGRRVGREWEQGSERKKNAVQYVVDFVSGRNDDLTAYTQGFFAQSYSYANGQRIQQVTKAWEGVNMANAPEGILPTLPEDLYIHEDIMGSTRRWSTDNGDTYAQVEYDVWGLPVQPGNDEENILNPRYTNHTYDDLLGMYHAQFRFLDATSRGFTAVDPIKDGLNWYGYCEANPATFMDPLGLEVFIDLVDVYTKEEEQKQISELRMIFKDLSNDALRISRIGESYNEYGSITVKYSVEIAYQHQNPSYPLGTQLVRDVVQSDYSTTIRYLPYQTAPVGERGSATVSRDYDAAIRGIPTSSFIFFMPQLDAYPERHQYQVNPLTGIVEKMPPQSFITIGHEFIHALRMANGDLISLDIKGFSYFYLDGRRYGYFADAEELMATGLFFYQFTTCEPSMKSLRKATLVVPQLLTKYTENQLRAEHGIPEREAYTNDPRDLFEY